MTDLYHHLTLFLREIKKTGEKPLVVGLRTHGKWEDSDEPPYCGEFNGKLFRRIPRKCIEKWTLGVTR